MNKTAVLWILVGTLLFGIMLVPSIVVADSSMASGGDSAQVSVAFRIVIPPTLYLQVQSIPAVPTQPQRPSISDHLTENPEEQLNTIDVLAYGSFHKNGIMYMASSHPQHDGNVADDSDSKHQQYIWKPHGFFTTEDNSESMNNRAIQIKSQSNGRYFYQLTDKISTPDPSNVHQMFILCSP